MMRRTVGAGALAGAVLLALASPAAADTHTSDSVTLKDGRNSLRLSWSIGCGTFKPLSSPEGTKLWSFEPWWNGYAKEKGQTRWRKVRFSYKYRDLGDTTIVKTVVGNIDGRNAVYDPPRYSFKDTLDAEADDIWGVGIRVAVSTDGKTFKTAHNSSMLTCAPPT